MNRYIGSASDYRTNQGLRKLLELLEWMISNIENESLRNDWRRMFADGWEKPDVNPRMRWVKPGRPPGIKAKQ